MYKTLALALGLMALTGCHGCSDDDPTSGQGAPTGFSLLSPDDGTWAGVLAPTFRWTSSMDHDNYSIEVSSSSDFRNVIFNRVLAANEHECTLPPGIAQWGVTYSWRVVAYNSGRQHTAGPFTFRGGWWAKSYGGAGDDAVACIEPSWRGGYLMAGTTGAKDAWVTKVDVNGVPSWTYRYGGAGDEEVVSVFEMWWSINPGYVVVGTTNSFGAGGHDVWIVRLDENGGIVWQNTYGGPLDDRAVVARMTEKSFVTSILVAGSTTSFGAGGTDGWLLKVAIDGAVMWQRAYGGAADDRFTDSKGEFVAGETRSFGAGGSDLWMMKVDDDGGVMWEGAYGGVMDETGAVLAEPGRTWYRYLLMGTTRSAGAGGADGWAAEVTTDTGAILAQRTFGGPGDDIPRSASCLRRGGAVVVGSTTSFGAGGSDAWVVEVGQDARMLRQFAVGGSGNDEARFHLNEDWSNDTLVVAGSTASFGAAGRDGWCLRMGTNGYVPPLGVEAAGVTTDTSGQMSRMARYAPGVATWATASPTMTGPLSFTMTVGVQAP